VLWLLSQAAVAAEPATKRPANKLSLLGLFANNTAMLFIDGERRVLKAGQTSPEGVTLISVDTEQVIIERNGRQQTLNLGMAAIYPGSENVEPGSGKGSSESVTLWADGRGFFHASGYINGSPVEFLVDTGASSVALSGDMARSIGIQFDDGDDGIATTAAGLTRMKRVFLDSVSIGNITLRNIEAGILQGSFPKKPLLGMSFLGQLDMLREGNRMELKRR